MTLNRELEGSLRDAEFAGAASAVVAGVGALVAFPPVGGALHIALTIMLSVLAALAAFLIVWMSWTFVAILRYGRVK